MRNFSWISFIIGWLTGVFIFPTVMNWIGNLSAGGGE